MFERAEISLKIACLAFAALLLFQLLGMVTRKDPLANVNLTALSVLASNTNAPISGKGTNAPLRSQSETNSAAPPSSARTQTNSDPTKPPSMPSPGMARMGPGMGPGAAPDLPPAIRARVDRIYQSEIFGPIIRPQPVALLGIAGKDVFLRAPSGQTGLVREGEELGGIKLIRIGTNRVLVEEDGQKRELTLFSGFGGETLLPTGKEK